MEASDKVESLQHFLGTGMLEQSKLMVSKKELVHWKME